MGLGIVLGLVIGLNIEGIWPSVPLHASATHGLDKFAIATGLVDDSVEALYFLDFLTGDMRAAVINPKTGKFNSFFTRNIAADFGGAGRNSGYLMVTGSVDMPRGTANFQYADSIVYVAEAGTGQVAAYTIPWNSSLQAAGKPQYGEFQPLDVQQFRTAFVRDEPASQPTAAVRARMKIQVNGEPREIAAGSTVAAAARRAGRHAAARGGRAESRSRPPRRARATRSCATATDWKS